MRQVAGTIGVVEGDDVPSRTVDFDGLQIPCDEVGQVEVNVLSRIEHDIVRLPAEVLGVIERDAQGTTQIGARRGGSGRRHRCWWDRRDRR